MENWRDVRSKQKLHVVRARIHMRKEQYEVLAAKFEITHFQILHHVNIQTTRQLLRSPIKEHISALHTSMEATDMELLAETSSKPCHLLDKMPGELRNKIWSLALDYPEGVVVDCVAEKLVTKNPTAIMSICKQIRQECGNLLFTQNELCLRLFSYGRNKELEEINKIIANHAPHPPWQPFLSFAPSAQRSQTSAMFPICLRTLPARVIYPTTTNSKSVRQAKRLPVA